MNEKIISRISVYLLAIVLICFGAYHLVKPMNMLTWVPSFLPGGINWVYLVGIIIMLVGISLITHWKVKLATYVLAVLIFSFVLMIHLPNYLHGGDAEYKTFAFLNMIKDTAIGSFALYIAANTHNRQGDLN